MLKSVCPKISKLIGIATVLFLQCSTDNTLEWQQADGYRFAELDFASRGKTGFTLLSPEKTGVTFQNDLTEEQLAQNHVLSNGSGVAVADIDGDGLTDLYFCRLDGPNVLYKNLGQWNFKDVTEQAGVACDGQFSSGAMFADIDGDRDADLLVTSIGGKNYCFLNDGNGVFEDVSEHAGLQSGTGATTMAMADIDGDGDVDLYQANYKALRAANIFAPQELTFDNLIEKNENDRSLAIRENYKEHFTLAFVDNFVLWEEKGEPDVLYLNDGAGRFRAATADQSRFVDENGEPAQALFDWGLAAKFQDLNDDGAPDLYVCNDFNSPDRIWLNDGAGRFRAIARQAIRHTSHSSMAVDFSDVDRDGDTDFFVLDMLGMSHQRKQMQFNTMPPLSAAPGVSDDRLQYMRNTLFLNRGDGSYAEIARMSGVDASDWSWAVSFADVDLDGYEDALIATGQLHDTQDLDARTRLLTRASAGAINSPEAILQYPPLALKNVCFRNNGNLGFEEVSQAWGFGRVDDISQGMALADLDNDGDLDVVMNRLGMPAAVYQNTTSADRIAVRLRGAAPNTQGAGAKITVTGGAVVQSKELALGGAYLSGSEPLAVFAANGEQNRYTIEVRWRNGQKSIVEQARANRIYEIDQAVAFDAERKPKPEPQPHFYDVSETLGHQHQETLYDDWQDQPLLSMKLSQLGPGVAMADLDDDGDDDIVITGGKGGTTAIYFNENGDWRREQSAFFREENRLDQTAAVGWQQAENYLLLVGHSNYEASQRPSFVVKYIFRRGRIVSADTVFATDAAIGALAAADYDVDGDVDLLVAGRSMPGQFPLAASSFLLKNQGATFAPDTVNNRLLEEIGLVTGAVFSDIDNKGAPDLILATHWGPVRYLRNEQGRFRDATEAAGLASYHGLWNGVTTGDFNEDGKLDIVATNWGRNTIYQFDESHPIRLYSGDFDLNGTLDLVEAYYSESLRQYVPFRSFDRIMRAVPFTRIRVPDYTTFATSGLQRIFGQKIVSANVCSLTTVEHALFIRKDDFFVRNSLPVEVQFAPAFAATVADFDGDGHADIFLSQNFFNNLSEMGKDDAGTGHWLRGAGTGELHAVDAQNSGIRVFGEQRGAAVGDLNGDGRIDLLVSQNGGSSRLFENAGAMRGLRVRLRGSEKNRHAIGARLQLRYADKAGPLLESKAGSGYWSQNSSTFVLGKRGGVVGADVYWPGKGLMTYRIPSVANRVVLDIDGDVRQE